MSPSIEPTYLKQWWATGELHGMSWAIFVEELVTLSPSPLPSFSRERFSNKRHHLKNLPSLEPSFVNQTAALSPTWLGMGSLQKKLRFLSGKLEIHQPPPFLFFPSPFFFFFILFFSFSFYPLRRQKRMRQQM